MTLTRATINLSPSQLLPTPHSPKIGDQESAEANRVNLPPSHTNAEIETLSARLNLKEGDQYAITGNDRAQLFVQRANAYQKEGALVFALNDLNAAVRLNRDLYATGEYSIKTTKLWEEMAKQIRIGQIDPEFPPFVRNDNIYTTGIRSYKNLLANGPRLSRASKAYALIGLACGITENIDRPFSFLPLIIESLSQALELKDESGQFILQGRDRAKALMTWGVALSDAYPLIYNHLRKPANQKLTEACDMVDDKQQPILEPSDYIEALVKRGINLWKLKKSDEAIEDLKKALSIYSETPLSKSPLETTEADIHFSLAEIYSENENFSEALIHFKRAFASKTLTRIYQSENMKNYMNLIREDGNFLLRGEDKAQALLVVANNARLTRDFPTCASFSQQAFELLSEMPTPSQDLFRFARALKTYAESKQGNPNAPIDVQNHHPLSLLERLARIPQELDQNSAFENLLEDPEIHILGRASILAERATSFIRNRSWEAALKDLREALVETYKQGPKANAEVVFAYDKLFSHIPYEIIKEGHVFILERPFSIIRRQWPVFLLNATDKNVATTELNTVHVVKKPRQVLPVPSQSATDGRPVLPQAAQKIQPYPEIQQQPQPSAAPKRSVPPKTAAGYDFSKLVPVKLLQPSTAPKGAVPPQLQAINENQTLSKAQQLLHSVKKGPDDNIPLHIVGQALQLLRSITNPSPTTLNLIAQMSAQVRQQRQPSAAPKGSALPKGPSKTASKAPAQVQQQPQPLVLPHANQPSLQPTEEFSRLREENERLRKELEELKRNSQQIGSKNSGAKRQKLDNQDPKN